MTLASKPMTLAGCLFNPEDVLNVVQIKPKQLWGTLASHVQSTFMKFELFKEVSVIKN